MKWLARLFKYGFLLILIGGALGAAALYGAYYYLSPDLPSTENLKDVRFQVPLRVYSSDGKLIAEYGEKRREPLNYAQVPPTLVHAFLAAEDDSFFTHPGVDYKGLLRAAVQLALTGEKRQGGSTITMQVARNFYLSNEKTYLRKLNEIFLAIKIEQQLSKEDILQLYLNKIYLGHRSYGVGAAARVYYGKNVGELTLAQTAMIAGLPKAPSRYNPVTNPQRAVIRRDYVLGRMHDLGYINDDQYADAVAQPVTARIHAADIEVEAPYVAEMARAFMTERFGDEAYTSGYDVYTTVDGRLQTAANKALRDALDDYDRRHGYHGPERRLEELPAQETWDSLLREQRRYGDLLPGLVTAIDKDTAQVYVGEATSVTLDKAGLAWARAFINEDRRGPAPKTPGDVLQVGDVIRVQSYVDDKQETRWRLAEVPRVTGALVSVAPRDGAILALVGGYDFNVSKFNRAVQAERQPGSGFKAFIYSAALENGYTPASIINDAPVVFDDPSLEAAWRPENYSGKFFGPTRLRMALTKSRNLVSIRLMRSMGAKAALEHIARFGFDVDRLPKDLSLALGSGTVTPLDMARGYAVLANGGYRVSPYYIHRVVRDGETVFETRPATVCETCPQGEDARTPDGLPVAPRAISAENRYTMYSMMQDVITRGTATGARVLKRNDLAGKTGTTNEQRDAWFNGYNQSLVAIAWVGFDSNDKLGRGEVGGRAALPAWIEYMREALKGVPDVPPTMPDTMVTVRIDPDTGLRAAAGDPDAIFEVFRPDEVPQLPSGATLHGATPGRGGGSAVVEDLF